SVLPVFADVARSWSEGHCPILTPYSWVCGNLAGEFQYGTFSVFVNAACVWIWKFRRTFPHQAAGLSIAHLFVLADGAFWPVPLSACSAAEINSPIVDGKLDRFFYPRSSAYGSGIGLRVGRSFRAYCRTTLACTPAR